MLRVHFCLFKRLSFVITLIKILFQIFPWILFIVASVLLYQAYKPQHETITVENHQVVLEKITTIGKLELVHYKFKDIVELEIKRPHPLDLRSNPKIVLIVSGEAVGCIDLTKIQPNSINIKADSLFIKLPDPELCYYKIDHKNSKVYDLQTAPFDDEKVLINAAYKSAESQLKKAAIDANILQQAHWNAEKVLKPLLENTTQKKVIFIADIPPQSFRK
jgi:hypothetical protein